MKISEQWLREWVNPAISSEKLCDQLTMAGLEVDEVAPVAGEFSGVVVGRVVECAQHPNADKLRVTKVDIGGDRLLDIVCGAPNCRQGLVVACATVGAVLPGDFKIKAAKLRGEPSEGMLCSYSELGMNEDHSGIIELPQDAPIGQDLRQYLQLDDQMIEISVTPNRADCFGMVGVARDISAVNNLPLTEQPMQEIAASIGDTLPITVEAPEAAPRYLGRIIKSVDVTAVTPLWMREKLRRCGIRSIDPVVDVTNYVLLELGHPMHAFDLQAIDGGIVVRFAKAGEKLRLLDGNEVSLTADTLVIADQHKPLAMAGIFGGQDSGVKPETKDILLEAAFFAPLAIVGKARQYGLHTDASHRYERGVDPQLQYRAMQRATALLLDICGGEAGPIIDVTHDQYLPQAANLVLRRSKLDQLIGYAIPTQQVTDILTRLGCQVTQANEAWQVRAPSWRFDLQIEEDLIEEVARIYGYNNIPDQPLKATLQMNAKPEADLELLRVKNLLVDRDYQEAITYSFVDPAKQQLLHPEQAALILPNPISSEMSAMRLSLWTGLLEAAVYNQNRQQARVRLFESGLRFIPDQHAEFGIRQELVLAGVITGNRYPEHWQQPKQAVDFFDLKGDVEAILALCGDSARISFQANQHPALHPGQSAAIYLDDEIIGYLGVIHPQLQNKFDLSAKTIVFEILWSKINTRAIPAYREISRFPANRRDIAVIVKEEIAASEVLATCRQAAGESLTNVSLFDVYQGSNIEPGYKSLAISLVLQDKSRTLAEEEIATIVDKCIFALQNRFDALLRE